MWTQLKLELDLELKLDLELDLKLDLELNHELDLELIPIVRGIFKQSKIQGNIIFHWLFNHILFKYNKYKANKALSAVP